MIREPRAPQVSVILVSYNTCRLTLECLESLFRLSGGADLEVIVADNASTDGSADRIQAAFPQVRLIRLPSNLGFAAANNLAARRAAGRYLLLLNPDTVLLNDTVGRLAAFAESHPRIGIVGGRTFFPDGSENPTSCWRRPTVWSLFCLGTGLASLLRRSRLFNPESMAHWGGRGTKEVDIVTGCLLLIRRELWQRLGGFDESFRMYGEDADLCLRARLAGAACAVIPEARIVHYGGASEPAAADKMVRLFQARARLCRKHWPRALWGYASAMLSLWAWTRMSALFIAGFRERSRMWSAVWRRRYAWAPD